MCKDRIHLEEEKKHCFGNLRTAVVAIRVNAVHDNRRSIRVLLWLGGVFYILSTFGLISVAYANIMGIRSFFFRLWKLLSGGFRIIVETALFSLTARLAAFRFSQKMECGTYYGSIFLEGLIYFGIVAVGALFSLV
ncbi:hypothetical protein H0H92_006936 [Tricholoma furcatifolium]|nr:hypothetical protein H0H92_006936 [Tricholoma furcatifolium]